MSEPSSVPEMDVHRSEISAPSQVPVIDVHNDNFQEVWPSMILAIKTASFVALDTELSGLGNRKLLSTKCVEDRYKSIASISRTRSVVSLGISCFKFATPANESVSSDRERMPVMVQTFNLMILCAEDYIVEPLTVKFLVEHGFDFNKQYARGIPYLRGNDKQEADAAISVRRLFSELVACGVPVVLHNAIVDLIFLYHSFYANLPATMQTFIADVFEIYKGGIYDTKYISEFVGRTTASYLEYIFRKSQRENDINLEVGQCAVRLQFPAYALNCPYVTYRDLTQPAAEGRGYSTTELRQSVCESFAAHGWCQNGLSCDKSHDIQLILDIDARQCSKHSKRRHRKRKNKATMSSMETDSKQVSIDSDDEESLSRGDNSDTTIDCTEQVARLQVSMNEESNVSNSVNEEGSHHSSSTGNRATGGHRAGFDAFMTGFVLATFVAKENKMAEEDMGISDYVNKVYLAGKDFPLSIVKSNFAKTSKDHKEKQGRLKTD